MSKLERNNDLSNNPAYIRCAMQAHEEGARSREVLERCACEVGLQAPSAAANV